jgi:hypothetical protein
MTDNATASLDITSPRAPGNVCGIVVCEAMQAWQYAGLFILTARSRRAVERTSLLVNLPDFRKDRASPG